MVMLGSRSRSKGQAGIKRQTATAEAFGIGAARKKEAD